MRISKTLKMLIIISILNSCMNNNIKHNNHNFLILESRGAPNDIKIFNYACNIFNEQSKLVKIKMNHIQWSKYSSKIISMAAAGVMPDILILTTTELYNFQYRDMLLDLTPFIENDLDFKKNILPDFYQTVLYSCEIKGKMFALPAWNNGLVVYFNKQLFDFTGLKYPDESLDFNEIIKIGLKIKNTSYPEKIKRYALNIYGAGRAYLVCAMNGVKVFDEYATKCYLDHPDAISALKWYYSLIYVHDIAPTFGEVSETGINTMFEIGSLAMYTTGTHMASRIGNKIEWGISPMFRNKRRINGDGQYICFAISKKTKHPDDAWKFLKLLVSENFQIRRSKINCDIPSRSSLAQKVVLKVPAFKNYPKIILRSMEKHESIFPKTHLFDEIDFLLKKELEASVRNIKGSLSLPAACTNSAKKINTFIQQNKSGINR
ncbi:MAG: hypothetical protein A2096_13030 [Spirochaetes bacterium GWF1_41_5]|nr:MAG: hypothetical protein A2096_13030 [Spirochaetes bacterium GWF1_41_5]HBE04725.1 hypothetical protein [Spirochaetia bacterium]